MGSLLPHSTKVMLPSPAPKEYAILPVPRDIIPSLHASATKEHVLWIGCSDSLVLETECLDVDRDELFVHRNLGGRVSNGDLSSGSALEWGVDLLKVDHIVVCGHYDCEVIKQELAGDFLHGWATEVTKLDPNARRPSNIEQLLEIPNARSQVRRFEEIYVLEEVEWLRAQTSVKKAVRERGLQIHALVYDKEKNKCVMLVEDEEKKS